MILMLVLLIVALIVGAIVLAWWEGRWIGERNVYRQWAKDLQAQRDARHPQR